jgi:predicted HD superfamily hydrolase involved in NAD metabolism
VSAQRRALEAAVRELPNGLREHVLRVVAGAQRLARRHGIDEERATVAALGHDLLRAAPPNELLARAEAAELELLPVERESPVLLHGPLSALVMAERFGVDDADVLDAARYHTTARAGMSQLERLLFVADKIEPTKVEGRPALAEASLLAEESLLLATRRLLEAQAEVAQRRGWQLHPNSVAALAELS